MIENEGREGGMDIDAAQVRELAELLAASDLSEIEVQDGERRIRLVRTVAAPAVAAAPLPVAVAASAPVTSAPVTTAAAFSAPEAPALPAGQAVKAPMVGTAYLASGPESAPFVAVGQAVKAGDTLLIIEAMKVMNPILAPVAGTVSAVMVENAQPVEYDQPLVVIA